MPSSPWKLADRAAHLGDRPDQELDDVEVVDRVLEEGAARPWPACRRATSRRTSPCTGMYWSSRKTTLITRPLSGSATRYRSRMNDGLRAG